MTIFNAEPAVLGGGPGKGGGAGQREIIINDYSRF